MQVPLGRPPTADNNKLQGLFLQESCYLTVMWRGSQGREMLELIATGRESWDYWCENGFTLMQTFHKYYYLPNKIRQNMTRYAGKKFPSEGMSKCLALQRVRQVCPLPTIRGRPAHRSCVCVWGLGWSRTPQLFQGFICMN